MKTLSITIDEGLLKELDQNVHQFSLGGRSEAVREAVREWLYRQALKKKIQKEIEGYRKKPVDSNEFGSLISAQEFPS